MEDIAKDCSSMYTKDQRREYNQKYYLQNKLKIAIQNKQYYEANKEYHAEYYQAHKAHKAIYAAKWKLENKQKIKDYFHKRKLDLVKQKQEQKQEKKRIWNHQNK